VVPLPPAGPQAAALSLEILGRTVLDRTLDTLRALPGLDQLIVGDLSLPLAGTGTNSSLPLAGRGRGGGLVSILVCDPDRPLLTQAMLTEFVERTQDDRVAVLVSPASDTYKIVRAGVVQTTLDRASLWELQGLSRFNQTSFDHLPDLELARSAGIPVRLIQGDPMNFAVRSPDECRVAELVLSQ
jgi:2-C-methyl-D-erythritol 4-phosphate cytidylyltransferase